jgi:hypothetical protein
MAKARRNSGTSTGVCSFWPVPSFGATKVDKNGSSPTICLNANKNVGPSPLAVVDPGFFRQRAGIESDLSRGRSWTMDILHFLLMTTWA